MTDLMHLVTESHVSLEEMQVDSEKLAALAGMKASMGMDGIRSNAFNNGALISSYYMDENKYSQAPYYKINR